MADTKISDLTQSATAGDGDLFPFALGVGGTPQTRAITMSNLASQVGDRLSLNEIKAFAAREQQVPTTLGGTFNSGGWRDRTLNTLEQHTASEVVLASNELTVPAGKWLLWWTSPVRGVNSHQSRIIINEAGTPQYFHGIGAIAGSAVAMGSESTGSALVDESASFTVKIQHQCQTSRTNDGFGGAGYGDSVFAQIFGILLGEATP